MKLGHLARLVASIAVACSLPHAVEQRGGDDLQSLSARGTAPQAYKAQDFAIKRSGKFQGTVEDFYKENFYSKDGYRLPKLNHEMAMFSRFLRGLAGAVFQAENFKQGGPIKCAPGRSCGNLDKLTVYRKLESKKKGMLSAGQLGVITIVKDHKAILVYPKSSTSVRNTVAALRAWPKARTKITEEFGQKHARVHPGYLAAADEIYDDTLRGLKDAASEFQGYTILFSGQSMGAAVATLLAARLRADRNFDIDGRMKEGMKVFPIAMARLGDQAFARGLAAMFPEMVRFTSRDDPIPALPPVGFGYDHTPVEAWMQKASNDDTDTVTFPTVICTGYANKMCNGGTNVVTGLYNWPENHVEYFGYPKL